MLDSLRRGAQTWVAKILFAVLILSFGVWGISGSLRGYGEGSLARVGSIEISQNEFSQAYQTQFDNLRRRFGGRITAEQARAFGFDQQVLSQLIGGAAIDNHTHDLKLGISDETIIARLSRDPRFAGADGAFNKAAYDGFLRQSGLSERALLATFRKEEVRDQLTIALVESINAPDALVQTLHKYREEARRIAHFTLDPAKLPALANPDDTALNATYEQNKRRFMTPERRAANILVLSADAIKKTIVVSDAEVKAAYEQNPGRFAVVERRRIQQIGFSDKAKAEAAAKAIAAGKSFDDVAKEAGAKPSDVDLGLVAKKGLIDQKIADAAFALAKDVVSPVVEGRFSNVLLRVTEIEAGKQRTLEEVNGELRDQLTTERLTSEIQKIHDQVEDGRSGGKSLKDLASAFKLTLLEGVNTDRTNKTADGKPAIDIPDGDKIATSIFATKQGAEADAVELPDGGYAWIDLQGTTPEKQRTFAEAQADVKALWVETETRKAISAAAKGFADRLAAGESIEKVAADAGGTSAVTEPTLRAGKPVGLTEAAVNQAFAIANGAAGSTDTVDGKSRIVFKVVEIIPAPPMKPDQAEKLKAELQRQLQSDAMASYLGGLQERYEVKVNAQAMQRAVGADRELQQ